MPEAAGGEGGHGAAKPDGVIHRYIYESDLVAAKNAGLYSRTYIPGVGLCGLVHLRCIQSRASPPRLLRSTKGEGRLLANYRSQP